MDGFQKEVVSLLRKFEARKGRTMRSQVLRGDLCLYLVLIGSFGSWRARLITFNQADKREGARKVGGKWFLRVQARVGKSDLKVGSGLGSV